MQPDPAALPLWPAQSLAIADVVAVLAEMTAEALAAHGLAIREHVAAEMAPLAASQDMHAARLAMAVQLSDRVDAVAAALDALDKRHANSHAALVVATETQAESGAADLHGRIDRIAAERDALAATLDQRLAMLGGRLDKLDQARGDHAADVGSRLDALREETLAMIVRLGDQAAAADRAGIEQAEANARALDAIADDVARLMGKADDAARAGEMLAARTAALEAREPEPGAPGEPGQDRPVIDMVATWGPETEALPKGCMVSERGSLFLSTREAHGPPSAEPSSWLALAAGAAIEGANYDGDRGLDWSIRSGHQTLSIDVPLPVPIHRGTWGQVEAYGEHDCVTWDGAVWRAAAIVAPGIEPGTEAGAAWVLMLPRGKTGRPGKDGGRGLPGPEGRGIAAVLEAVVDDAILFELSDGTIARVDLSPLVQSIAAAIREGRP
jgi:hypothetical protein